MTNDAKREKARHMAGLFGDQSLNERLEFFVEVADRAGDVDSAGDAALTVLDALDDTRGLAALRTVGRLRRVHYFFTVTSFCDLSHCLGVSPSWGVSAHASCAGGFNVAVLALLPWDPSPGTHTEEADSLGTVYLNRAGVRLRVVVDRHPAAAGLARWRGNLAQHRLKLAGWMQAADRRDWHRG